MFGNKPSVYLEPKEDETSHAAPFRKPESNCNTLFSLPLPPKVVLFSLLPGQVHYLMWWLGKLFVDHLGNFYMYVEMVNDKRSEMDFKFQNSLSPSVLDSMLNVDRKGLNLTAANNAVTTQKFCVFSEQCQAFG